MRVMYFAYEGFDSPNGTNHLAIKLIDYLLNPGVEICPICADVLPDGVIDINDLTALIDLLLNGPS